jgi:hypothetical protein
MFLVYHPISQRPSCQNNNQLSANAKNDREDYGSSHWQTMAMATATPSAVAVVVVAKATDGLGNCGVNGGGNNLGNCSVNGGGNSQMIREAMATMAAATTMVVTADDGGG